MRAMLFKEFKLALHPTAWIFLALSAMALIPNYPYYIIFFYGVLGIFFICLQGRENQDISYTLSLPVMRRDAVRGRFALCMMLEGAQWVLTALMCILRARLPLGPNEAGMDANMAFLGFSLFLLGVFNAIFFPRYYGAPGKPGVAFGWGAAAMGVGMAVLETLAHVPWVVKNYLDTPDPLYMLPKLAVLLFGAAAFALLTCRAYRVSVRRFEKIDL